MNEARDKARFKELLHELSEAFKARTQSQRPEFIGQAPGDPLEHTTRRFVINDMLAGLGWDLRRMTNEMVEEARVQGKAILRMDYTGVAPNTGAPLLIVEAKAWARPFITPSSSGEADQGSRNEQGLDALLVKAIEHYKKTGSPNNSPVTREWADTIEQLHSYIVAVHRQSGHRVPRVAITSGRWMVIFLNPYETFVETGDVSTRSLKIFNDGEIVDRSDEIYDCLARAFLIDDLPDYIQPAQLSGYVNASTVRRIFHALWIARKNDGAHFQLRPQISLYPGIIVERSDGKLVTVIDPQRTVVTIPHSYVELGQHIASINQAAAALLRTVNTEIGAAFTPSLTADFPGFSPPPKFGTSALAAPRMMRSSTKAFEFLLSTGASGHFLLEQPSIAQCAGHSSSDCHALGESVDVPPIMSRSFDPASFFMTSEPHHCAHRTVHQRREARCQILAFEGFLCCRACAFQNICWSGEELAQLPCGTLAPQAEQTPAENEPLAAQAS